MVTILSRPKCVNDTYRYLITRHRFPCNYNLSQIDYGIKKKRKIIYSMYPSYAIWHDRTSLTLITWYHLMGADPFIAMTS